VTASAPADVKLLSIVMPARDEAGVIGTTLERIAALDGQIEVVVVSDGSTDQTFAQARAALRAGTVVELGVNAGSHAAIRCGLRHARGDYVAVLAADGQDPPESLPEMVRMLEHVDVVWGRRRDRANDRRRVRFAAAAYYRVFRALTGLDYPPSGLDFFVARRRVVESVLARSGRNTSLHLQLYNLGFKQAFVDYERGARSGGRSKWTFRARAKLAVDMLTGVSAAPVRAACLVGVAAGAAGVVGLASPLAVACVMGCAGLIALGLLGEYTWRILDEVRGAPLFVEDRRERVEP